MSVVHVMGVGMTPWGKFPDRTFVELGVEALRQAIGDAGIEWREVESLSAASHVWGGLPGILAANQLVNAMGASGIPVSNSYNACASTGLPGTLPAARRCRIWYRIRLDKVWSASQSTPWSTSHFWART